jgi:hypothetical protein
MHETLVTAGLANFGDLAVGTSFYDPFSREHLTKLDDRTAQFISGPNLMDTIQFKAKEEVQTA